MSSSNESVQMFPARGPSAWKYCLEKAMHGTDLSVVLALVHATEGAMVSRWQEPEEDYPLQPEENAEMLKACDELLVIKQDRLGWPSIRG